MFAFPLQQAKGSLTNLMNYLVLGIKIISLWWTTFLSTVCYSEPSKQSKPIKPQKYCKSFTSVHGHY